MSLKKKKLRVRKAFRFPPEIMSWAETQAAARHKTLTQFIVDLMVEAKQRAEP